MDARLRAWRLADKRSGQDELSGHSGQLSYKKI